MRYFNEFYTYPDIGLWENSAWDAKKAKGSPLLMEAFRLSAEQPMTDFFAGRSDAVHDSVNREPYFQDVVDGWKEKGLVFTAAGMMGISMVPVSVMERRNYDAKILFVPAGRSRENKDPNWAMNLLENNRAMLEKAAAEEVLVQFLPMPLVTELGLETQGTFKIAYDHVYLCLNALKAAGKTLADVQGIDPADFGLELCVAGVPVVDFSDKWQDNMCHQRAISNMYLRNIPEWDFQMQVHSACGRKQAESFHIEQDYTSPFDVKMPEYWESRGLQYNDNYYGRDWYVTVAPKSINTKPDHKLPLVLIMKEPRTAFPQVMQTAFQFYYEYLDLAAQGQMMLLYFALETVDDNDILVDIIEDAAKKYPIDPQRIYVTGQSHNGYYALEFYRRHPDIIAAAATLCDPIGLQLGATMSGVYEKDPEAIIASFAAHEMPLINFNGQFENKYPTVEAGSELEQKFADYYHWRLRAFRCADRSTEEIKAAKTSADYVTRKNGVPADRTEVQFVMGTELYISDLQNEDGKWWLRFVTQENLPHMITPQMPHICWSFLRRFARDRETGRTIELY